MDLKTSALLLKYSPSDVQRVRYVVEYANHNTNNPSEYIDVHTHSNAQKEIAKIFIETANAATLNMKSSDASPKIDTVKEKETTVDPQCENQKTINAKPSGASAKTEEVTVEGAKKIEEKAGLWKNVHDKDARIKAGSGEKKAKPGDKDYPETLNVEEVENLDELSKTTTANYLYNAKVDKSYVHGGDSWKARDKGIKRAEKKLGSKLSKKISSDAGDDASAMRRGSASDVNPGRSYKVKEEVENLDELSKKTLGGYVAKASKEVAGHMKYTGDNPDAKKIKQAQIHKRIGGMTQAGKKMSEAYDDVYEKYDNRYSDNTGEESAKKKAALEKKRGMKLDNHPQFKREDVEHIEEKDTSVMKKYLDDKAKKLTKKRDAQPDRYKNNPAFDSTSPNPKYEGVLHKVKEAVDNYNEELKMTKKEYGKIHKDFKSDDPKNPRTTKYVPGKGTVSMPVKFVEHHQKDENGKVIEHEDTDTTPSSVEEGKTPKSDKMYDKCWTGYKKVPGKARGEKGSCVKAEEVIKSTTFVISETPKGDVGKDRATKVKDRSARSYGGSDTFGKKYHSGARKVIHDMKRGVKKMKGSTNRPDSKYSGYIDDRKGKSHFHNEGQGLAGTKKHGKSDYDEPSRKKVKKENYSWRERMEEGMATPESGTGKYYVQGKPTAMQLKKRAEMEKVKKYGSVEAHDKKMNK